MMHRTQSRIAFGYNANSGNSHRAAINAAGSRIAKLGLLCS